MRRVRRRQAADLSRPAEQFPGDNRYEVIEGDCNATIDEVLRELPPLRWAPTFAILDQQAAEIHWSTIEKVAESRQNKGK